MNKQYQKPAMTIVVLVYQSLLLENSNSDIQGGGTLGSGWTDSGGDAWDDSSSSGSGSSFDGGWTDSGGDAWE